MTKSITAPSDHWGRLSLAALQRSHIERQEEWCPEQKPDLSFRGNELGGECGEAQNVIKKLERERHGWRGSRDTIEHLGEELADVIHCAVLCAITASIDLEPAVIAKFNSTSEKNGLSTLLATASGSPAPAPNVEGPQDISTVPPMTDVLVWWPVVKLDDYGDPTDEIVGGCWIISEDQGGYWIEPEVMNAIGDHMGDDHTYADKPSHWMPLPAPLFVITAPEGSADV